MTLRTIARVLAGLRYRLRAAAFARQWHARPVALPSTVVAEEPLDENGPGMQKWAHYFEVYRRHLEKFVARQPVVVEVGVQSGGSLAMWHRHFGPGTQVHGVDIDRGCASFADAATTIHIGDQADRSMWARFRESVPRVDVFIDDGGHTPEQQWVTLEEMLPHLVPGGVYICEDIHRAGNRFAEAACALVHALDEGAIVAGTGVDTCAPTAFQSAIHGLHFYPFVLVIEKRAAPETQFRAPLRGSQWRTAADA